MVNMKMESGKENESSTLLTSPDYPMGLCIYLDEDQLAKLKMDELPKVGELRKLIAVVSVKSVSVFEDEENGMKRSLSLQITDLELSGIKDGDSAASKMYKKDGPDNGIKLEPGSKVVGEGYF